MVLADGFLPGLRDGSVIARDAMEVEYGWRRRARGVGSWIPQLAIWRTRSHETWPSPGGAARVERGSAPCAAALVSRSTAVPRGCGALVPAPAETSRNRRHDE
jgi:hypothetical protein